MECCVEQLQQIFLLGHRSSLKWQVHQVRHGVAINLLSEARLAPTLTNATQTVQQMAVLPPASYGMLALKVTQYHRHAAV
jgi:hypothetical protein